MYFETGQGSELSSDAHHGADQVTMEARCYGFAKRFDPFLVNTVVGFIGPEYLYDSSRLSVLVWKTTHTTDWYLKAHENEGFIPHGNTSRR